MSTSKSAGSFFDGLAGYCAKERFGGDVFYGLSGYFLQVNREEVFPRRGFSMVFQGTLRVLGLKPSGTLLYLSI